jgi:hypothetical protein
LIEIGKLLQFGKKFNENVKKLLNTKMPLFLPPTRYFNTYFDRCEKNSKKFYIQKKILFNKITACEKIIALKLAKTVKYPNICIGDTSKGLFRCHINDSTNAFLCSLHLNFNTALLYHQSATTAQHRETTGKIDLQL